VDGPQCPDGWGTCALCRRSTVRRDLAGSINHRRHRCHSVTPMSILKLSPAARNAPLVSRSGWSCVSGRGTSYCAHRRDDRANGRWSATRPNQPAFGSAEFNCSETGAATVNCGRASAGRTSNLAGEYEKDRGSSNRRRLPPVLAFSSRSAQVLDQASGHMLGRSTTTRADCWMYPVVRFAIAASSKTFGTTFPCVVNRFPGHLRTRKR
jgi:hypothetical protein